MSHHNLGLDQKRSETENRVNVERSSFGIVARMFSVSAGAVLLVTGIAKAWSGLGNSKYLAAIDPIIAIKFWQLLRTVGAMEIVVALVCFHNKRSTLATGLVAWLSSSFAIYRFGLWWIGWKKPCSCLGNLTDALNVSPQAADNIMKVVLAYLLVGSYGLLIWQWRQNRKTRSTSGIQNAVQTGG